MDANFPQTPSEWAQAVWYSLGIDKTSGQALVMAGEFPYRKLALWIQERFTDGGEAEFVPALLRNIRGLTAWIYSDGAEPKWSGSDPIRDTGELY